MARSLRFAAALRSALDVVSGAALVVLLMVVLPHELAAQRPAGLEVERNPAVTAAVEAVSAERIAEYVGRLVSFGTRHTLSDTLSSTRGIGAARRYIHDTFQEFSRECGGCLDVSYDPHDVVIARFPNRPTARVVNVVARLPGRVDPDRWILVTGHYDSCICSVDGRDASRDAPGANDDASGTAAVMELARVISRQFPEGLDATVVFAPVAGEEQGLLGSRALAARLAADTSIVVGAVVTNDIIGNVRGQKGGVDSVRVRVFGGEPDDGPARHLARYAKAAGEGYVTGFEVSVVGRLDRIGRGGDHRPFWELGLPAVRFSETLENYLHQHRPEDRLEYVSVPYIRKVTQVNAAALTSLALAPRAPTGLRMRRITDSGGVDWNLSWTPVPNAPDLAGYEVTVRRTTDSYVTRIVPVGNVDRYTLEDTQADDLWIGLRSVDREGNRSLVASFHAWPALPAARSATSP